VPNARGRGAKQQLTLYLHMNGLDTRASARPEHLWWTVPQLRVGNRIAIRVVDAKKVDAPSTRHYDAPELRKPREKYFAAMKRVLKKSKGEGPNARCATGRA